MAGVRLSSDLALVLLAFDIGLWRGVGLVHRELLGLQPYFVRLGRHVHIYLLILSCFCLLLVVLLGCMLGIEVGMLAHACDHLVMDCSSVLH